MMKTKVAKVNEIKEGQPKSITINGKEIAIFKINSQLFAIDNQCLHMGGPLSEGLLENDNITCPLHGWQFDVKSGKCIMPGSGKLNNYKVIVDKDEIFIEI